MRPRLKAVRLVIAGQEGHETPRLRATALRLGLGEAAQFLGRRNDVAELLCAADVVAIPSRWEGLPGALLEAMALEAPIVASDLPAMREAVVDGLTATLVPPGDPGELADAMVGVLEDTAGAAVRARAARESFLERFTIDAVADQMVSFYERALTAAPRRKLRAAG